MIFFVCTAHRSGGFLLMSLLNSTALFGELQPIELFSRDSWKQFADFPWENRHEMSDTDLLSTFSNMRESQSGGLASKIFPRDSALILRYLELKGISVNDVKWIWLRRTNKIRQAISFHKAGETDQWHPTMDTPKPDENHIEIDIKRIEYRIIKFVLYEIEWKSFFEEHKLNPLCIDYEDFMHESKWTSQVERVLDFLEIPHQFPIAVSTDYVRQSTDWNEEIYSQLIDLYRKKKI